MCVHARVLDMLVHVCAQERAYVLVRWRWNEPPRRAWGAQGTHKFNLTSPMPDCLQADSTTCIQSLESLQLG